MPANRLCAYTCDSVGYSCDCWIPDPETQRSNKERKISCTQFATYCDLQRLTSWEASFKGFRSIIETPAVHSSQHPLQAETLRHPSLSRFPFNMASTEPSNVSPSMMSDRAGQAKRLPEGSIATYSSPAWQILGALPLKNSSKPFRKSVGTAKKLGSERLSLSR